MAGEVRVCKGCGETKPLTDEHYGKNAGRWRALCRECYRAANRRWKIRADLRLAKAGLSETDLRSEKRCPRCLQTLPLTTEHWSTDGRAADGTVLRFAGWCRTCKAASQRERYAANVEAERERRRRSYRARMDDPEVRERERVQWRERHRKARKANPEAERERQRRYDARKRTDPDWRARDLDYQRMDRILRMERQGVAVPPRGRDAAVKREGTPRIHGDPFRAWLAAIFATEPPIIDGGRTQEVLGEWMGTTARHLQRVLNQEEGPWVELDFVDRAFTLAETDVVDGRRVARAGPDLLATYYPALYEPADGVQAIKPNRTRKVAPRIFARLRDRGPATAAELMAEFGESDEVVRAALREVLIPAGKIRQVGSGEACGNGRRPAVFGLASPAGG